MLALHDFESKTAVSLVSLTFGLFSQEVKHFRWINSIQCFVATNGFGK